MNINDEYTVRIEKLTNLGLGLAKIDGYVVFVENSCPEDIVKIKIQKVKKNFANATILEIISPSRHRISPNCAMQKVCGACQIQFINYEYQLELKQEIVKDTLHSIGGFSTDIPLPVPSPEIYEFRHKIQYPISQTKNSKRILAGYYKPATHEIVNIKHCPIQPKICDDIIDYIRQNCHKFNIDGYIEKSKSGILRHVVIRNSSYDGKNLVVLVVNQNEITSNLKDFAGAIYETFEEVTGVCVNFNTKNTNVILGDFTKCLCGKEYIIEKMLDKSFVIGAETFFQVNPKSAENIFRYVKEYLKKNFNSPNILDAYAGISAFGICLSDVCSKVTCVETNQKSTQLAQKCLELNNIKNIQIVCEDTGTFLNSQTEKYDVMIFDPPRKGCSKDSLDNALKFCKDTLIYVSCNPATLARDLKYLNEKGCDIISIQPFDMFCHSYHIENVAIIKINKTPI